ncbi:hypothetical protein A9505_00160 [Methanobrevibacter sp. A27]|uniref:hypothetical protein n=1 Tax=Methanobrevibacter gottschalkii TaxID=190974 RepID=UPI00084C6D65|nr:hypothetical protein [Methanobrevibacter gottschalkii]OEC99548.1 hypothetical protein A9505_00160 [Methanobrevibacter sp. A27]
MIIVIVISTVLSVSYAHPGHGHYVDEITSEDVGHSNHPSSDSHDSSGKELSSKSSSNSRIASSHSNSKSNKVSSSDTSNSDLSNKHTSSQSIKSSKGDVEPINSQNEEMPNNTQVKNTSNITNHTITEEAENTNLLTQSNILLFILVAIVGFCIVVLFDKFKNR